MEDASSPALDSADAADGAQAGGVTFEASGKIGLAVTLDGTDDTLDFGDISSVDNATQLTVEYWMYPTGSLGYGKNGIRKWDSWGEPFMVAYGDQAGGDAFVRVASTDETFYTGSDVFTSSAWNHAVHVWKAGDNTAWKTFVNGVSKSLTKAAATASNLGANATHLKLPTGGPTGASWDEIRISTTAFSDGWNQTNYAAQNDPSSFYSVGGETTP